MTEQIGFVGIGAMGEPMATNLLCNGFPVTTIIHQKPERVKRLETRGAHVVSTLSDLLAECPIVVACLPTSTEVEELVLGSGGIIEAGRSGTVFVDMGTSRPTSTRMLADRLQTRGIVMLDAPVTGGVVGARDGTLTIYVGGPGEEFARVRPMFDAIGRTVLHMGGIACGHLTKLFNQALSLASMATLAEVLPLGVRVGLNPARLIEALNVGSAATALISSRGGRILRRDFAPSFRLDLARKDMRLAAEVGHGVNMPIPMISAALFSYTMACSLGLDGEDTVALVKMWEKILGVVVQEPLRA